MACTSAQTVQHMPGRKIISPKLEKSTAPPVEIFRNAFVQVLLLRVRSDAVFTHLSLSSRSGKLLERDVSPHVLLSTGAEGCRALCGDGVALP